MSNNAHIQKVVQVAEEAAPPLHVPIRVGNEILIVHQQDVRNTIDTRYLAYSRLGPNGEIIPLILPNLGQNVVGPSGVITGIVPSQAISCPSTQSPLPMGTAFANLQDLVNYFHQSNQSTESPLPMAAAFVNLQDLITYFQQRNQLTDILNKSCVCRSPVATIQPMDCSNTSKQLPLTYNVGTSTSEFKETQHRATQCTCCCVDKQCETNIVIRTDNKVEKEEVSSQRKKDATTCTTSSEEFKTKSNLILYSSSDDQAKAKNSKEGTNCYPKNQESKNQRKKNLKTRFMID